MARGGGPTNLVCNVRPDLGNVAIVLPENALVVIAVQQLVVATLSNLHCLQSRAVQNHNQSCLGLLLLFHAGGRITVVVGGGFKHQTRRGGQFNPGKDENLKGLWESWGLWSQSIHPLN